MSSWTYAYHQDPRTGGGSQESTDRKAIEEICREHDAFAAQLERDGKIQRRPKYPPVHQCQRGLDIVPVPPAPAYSPFNDQTFIDGIGGALALERKRARAERQKEAEPLQAEVAALKESLTAAKEQIAELRVHNAAHVNSLEREVSELRGQVQALLAVISSKTKTIDQPPLLTMQ